MVGVQKRLKGGSLASGTTAGSTTRLLVPNTIVGRPQCLLSRVPQTRPIFIPIQGQGLLMFLGCPTGLELVGS